MWNFGGRLDSPTVCLGTLALFIPPTCFSRTADLRSGPLASGLLPRRSTFSLCVACPIVLKRGPAWGPEVSVCSLRCRRLFAGFWPDILGVAAQLAVQNPCLHKTVGPVALYLRTHCGRSVGVHVVDVARADNERSEGWFALAWEWICGGNARGCDGLAGICAFALLLGRRRGCDYWSSILSTFTDRTRADSQPSNGRSSPRFEKMLLRTIDARNPLPLGSWVGFCAPWRPL